MDLSITALDESVAVTLMSNDTGKNLPSSLRLPLTTHRGNMPRLSVSSQSSRPLPRFRSQSYLGLQTSPCRSRNSALDTISLDPSWRQVLNLWRYVHELWAVPIEVGIALWLLYRQLGLAFLGPAGVAVISTAGTLILSKYIGNAQKIWMEVCVHFSGKKCFFWCDIWELWSRVVSRTALEAALGLNSAPFLHFTTLIC